jgi:hypothetical protein
LDGTLAAVVATPCDSTAATTANKPTAVGFKYDKSDTAADTITMLRVDILKVDGTKLSHIQRPCVHHV